MLNLMKSQTWNLYQRAAEHLSVDGLRLLSLTFFEAAQRLQVDAERRAAAGERSGLTGGLSPLPGPRSAGAIANNQGAA